MCHVCNEAAFGGFPAFVPGTRNSFRAHVLALHHNGYEAAL